MTAVMLDEDGRCVRTGLLPDQCACERHRNIAPPKPTDGWLMHQMLGSPARYEGRCVICTGVIAAGEEIFRPAQEDDTERLGFRHVKGYGCQRCLKVLLDG